MDERERADNPPADPIHSLKVSKDSIGLAVMNVCESVNSGNLNPLEAIIRLKALETFVKDSRTQIERYAIEEANKHGSKSFTFMGAEIQLKPTKTDYDYSVCNDPILERLEIEAKWANEKVKERQTFLRAISGKETIVDTLTGEVAEIKPPVKIQKDGIAITIR